MNCARNSSCCGSACSKPETTIARSGQLLLGSVSAFGTLFRHALLALGDAAPHSKREAIQILATRIPFEPSAFLQLLDIRDHKADRKQFDVKDVFTRYLAAVQHVTAAVDTMLDNQLNDAFRRDRVSPFL